MNRAVNGDVVVVEVLPEAEWKAPGEEVLDQEGKFDCKPSYRSLKSCQSRSRTTTRMTRRPRPRPRRRGWQKQSWLPRKRRMRVVWRQSQRSSSPLAASSASSNETGERE